jgi:phosphoglycerate kinase
MRLRTLSRVNNLRGKTVLVRADLNVPVRNGSVQEPAKILAAAPTIAYLQHAGARVVILSHLGRPRGVDAALSLKVVLPQLSDALSTDVVFEDAPYWNAVYASQVKKRIAALPEGGVMLFENTRFAPGEEKKDTAFSRLLASYGDLFVLDGFAVAHRDAASVTGVAQCLPRYAGLLLAQEIAGLSRVLSPKKPSVLVLGGIKMETKIPVLKSLLPRMDSVLLCAGIVNTLFAARGYGVGDSVVEPVFGKDILRYAANKKVHLPVDVVVGRADGKVHRVIRVPSVPSALCATGESVYDIGPQTIREYAEVLRGAKTIVWNGACGYMEVPPYNTGTLSVARVIASVSRGECFGVVGGGETVSALTATHMEQYVDLVSTGGGAMLEFLSGKTLPGIRAVSSFW